MRRISIGAFTQNGRPSPAAPPPSSHLIEPRTVSLCYGIMSCHREETPALLTRLAYALGMKLRPATVPLSESLLAEPPTPQTSLSADSRINSPDRALIYCTSQFSNSQTSSSCPSSLMFLQIPNILVIGYGSVFCTNSWTTIIIDSECGFYAR